jgi:putative SOS response-associated peptidase YedK
MCGRARLSSDVSELKVAFAIPPERPTPNFAASWNVAPTDPLPVVRYVAKDHQRSIEVMRWGLIPYWAKDEKIGFSTINAGPTRSTPTRRSASRSDSGAA